MLSTMLQATSLERWVQNANVQAAVQLLTAAAVEMGPIAKTQEWHLQITSMATHTQKCSWRADMKQ